MHDHRAEYKGMVIEFCNIHSASSSYAAKYDLCFSEGKPTI